MKSSWTQPLKVIRKLPAGEKDEAFRKLVFEECGAPLSVREARRQLYLLTAGALAGRPRLIAVGDDKALLMSVADLEVVLLDLALAKVVEGFKALPRRKVQNR